MALSAAKPLVAAASSFGAGSVHLLRHRLLRGCPRRTRPPGRARPATVSPRWPPGGGGGGGEARPAESDVRCQEYVAGLRDAGLPVRPERVVRTERVPFASGAAAARALLGQAPDTDAVFALGDALAPGALRGLHDAGRVVPDDTAVAGFANVAQAAFSTPPSPRSAPAARNWPGVPCRSSPNSPGRGRPGVPLPPARHHTVGFRLAEREPSGVPAQ
ncbi:hypothetical protein TPA0906_11500 [Streptomyces olivaceus]|uniref:substrate-binding domain-containing protein n=1 Tax=Streptomyces olivaceus TaxID=47716 RepID=UPI0022EF0B8A|nr:substrate-binding domain-containing protein [Streptomyces olivaceus]GHI99284.1 hypothetical protein TPA0906_11500 [Streptomyces olivaceus]